MRYLFPLPALISKGIVIVVGIIVLTISSIKVVIISINCRYMLHVYTYVRTCGQKKVLVIFFVWLKYSWRMQWFQWFQSFQWFQWSAIKHTEPCRSC